MRILGRWQSRKHQKSVSLPRQQLELQNLSDVTILDFWSLLKACKFQGKLKLIKINSSLLSKKEIVELESTITAMK